MNRRHSRHMHRFVTLALLLGALLLRHAPTYAQTVYTSDFETDDGGWIESGYGDWERGTIVPGIYETCDTVPALEPTASHSGVSAWATNLNGCYTNANADSILSQTFDFTNRTAPIQLSWWHWYHVFETFDYAVVQVNGTQVWRTPNSTASADWAQQTVDLSAYAGNPSVTITFRLHATTVVNRSGWYLDDMSISDGTLVQPEIDITGNQLAITTGDTTPALSDHTDFGNVTIGQSLTHTFTISNTGLADLSLNGTPPAAISGSGDFSVVMSPSTVVNSGSATTVQIRFDPSAPGTQTATVSIPNTDSDESPYTFAIQGTGANTAPVANAGPPQLVGAGALVTLDGSASSDPDGHLPLTYGWTQVGGTPVVLSTAAAPQPSFSAPAGAAVLTFTLTVTDSFGLTDPTPDSVAITVAPAAPVIGVFGNHQLIASGDTTPSVIDGTDFGSLDVGQSLSHTFIISNTGGSDLHLLGTPLVAISGVNAADFRVIVEPMTPIAPGAATNITLLFEPEAAGLRTASIMIASNNGDTNGYMFTVQGSGIAPSPPPPTNAHVYLPQVVYQVPGFPDLVIEHVSVSNGSATIAIRNRGSAPVTEAFWVDLYVNPSQPPQLNQPWQAIAPAGSVWGVTGSGLAQLIPGGTLTLVSGDAYYFSSYSSPAPIPAASQIYVLADSVNLNSAAGAVAEADETNNQFGPVAVTSGGSPSLTTTNPADHADLPPR